MGVEARPIPVTRLLNQEGVVAAVALAGLVFTSNGIVAALSPTSSWLIAVGAGLATAGIVSGALFGLRSFVPLRRLEAWQRVMVSGWSFGDAAVVACFSGLAEEALVRALLQPLIGLVPAALLFALLHLVPDWRLVAWPVIALVLGLCFGVLFDLWGYPAAAAAHVVVNLISLIRLRRQRVKPGEYEV